MKRKPLSVLLAASMVVSMTACGQKAEETTTAVTTEATSAMETLTTEVPTTEEVSQEKTLYTEGTYTGTTRGMNGKSEFFFRQHHRYCSKRPGGNIWNRLWNEYNSY